MTKNYRSTPEIVWAVNSLIAKNRERIKKDLVSQLHSGPKVTVFHAETTVEEAHLRRIRSWRASRPVSISATTRCFITRAVQPVPSGGGYKAPKFM